MAIQATTNWYVRAGGNQLNGGGYDSGISGATTNYCDQDAAQLSLTDLTTTGAGVTTITSVTGGFTSAMVGNCIRISAGTNFQTGYYFIITYTDTNNIIVDRTPTSGGAGVAGTGRIGGATDHIKTYANGGGGTQPTLPTPLVAGNTINIRGAGLDDPTTVDYDWSGGSGYWQFPAGTSGAGRIKFVGYNGRPLIAYCGLVIYTTNYISISNLKGKVTVSSFNTHGFSSACSYANISNCIIDQNGLDVSLFNMIYGSLQDCELRNTGATTIGTSNGVQFGANTSIINGCYIHNLRGVGINASANNGGTIVNNIIANCKSDSILVNGNVLVPAVILGNTIDNGGGHGINFTTADAIATTVCMNNIISNHSTAGKYGINCNVGTTAVNDRAKTLMNYNNLFGNNGTYNNVSAGANDTALDPQYVNAAGANWAVGTNMKAIAVPSAFRGSSTTSYLDEGAVQRQDAGGGGTTYIYNLME